jgi:hypothetical protein
MNTAMRKHGAFDINVLDVANVATLAPLSLPVSCELAFPIVGLKIYSVS